SAKFCGPSTISGAWSVQFAEEFGSSRKIAFISQHMYPFGAGNKVTDPAQGIERILSTVYYDKNYASFGPHLLALRLPYRLEETNNFYNGGAKDVSNTFAAALWGLDYLYWWAGNQALGVNFHNGDTVAAGNASKPCLYASFTTAPNGYIAHPLAYAIKAFDLGAHGQFIPSGASGPQAGGGGQNAAAGGASKDLNLYQVAVLSPDKKVYITLINDSHGAGASASDVVLAPSSPSYTHADSISLIAPKEDVTATTGVTLGGAAINADGSWQGTWTPLPNSSSNKFAVKVPPASAVIVRLIP
ncbi:MAG TPA: hypothetical protein VL981_14730, partial [Candidatus Methylacidiphilales bacterium]|nr:hypothetical protein [Candidatus Methylacidiphilales bacterium]